MLERLVFCCLLYISHFFTSYADTSISSVHLPLDLDRSEPFEILHSHSKKLTVKWLEEENELLIPFSPQTSITMVQGSSTWNFQTRAVEASNRDTLFQIWHKAAKHSNHPYWHDIPLKRKFYLALLAIPFAFLCFKAQKPQHYLCLGLVVLLFFIAPKYKQIIILHADQSWEISLDSSNASWLQWEKQPRIGLKVSQVTRPKLTSKPSNLGLWIAPDLEHLGCHDHLWQSSHHLVTVWRR